MWTADAQPAKWLGVFALTSEDGKQTDVYVMSLDYSDRGLVRVRDLAKVSTGSGRASTFAQTDDQVMSVEYVADIWGSLGGAEWAALTSVLSIAWDGVNNWLNQPTQLCILKNWSAAMTAGCILIPEPIEFITCSTLALVASVVMCN